MGRMQRFIIAIKPQDADAAKEKNHKRRGAAPPLKVLLF